MEKLHDALQEFSSHLNLFVNNLEFIFKASLSRIDFSKTLFYDMKEENISFLSRYEVFLI